MSSVLRRRAALFTLLFALLSVGLAAVPGMAWAGNEPAFGTVEVSASNWMTANNDGGGVTVYSNGDTSYYSGISSGYGTEWQCVELAQRLWDTKGWHSGLFTSGGSVISYAYQIYGMDNATSHPNDGSYTPVPGDLIVHNGSSTDPAGHVAVVNYVSGNKVYVAEQNVATAAESSAGQASYTIGANGVLTRDQSIGLSIEGIVHSPNDPYTNGSPTPAPTRPIVGQPGTVQGDFNGDGKPDLAVFYNYGNATTSIWLFLGDGNGGFSAPIDAWDSGAGNWDWTVSKPFVGDFNGDGKADIGVLYGYSGSTSKMWVFTSQGTTFSSPTMVWDSGAGNFDWSRAKWVVPGDFNNDGKADVAVMYGYDNAQTAMFVFTGNGTGSFNSPAQWWNSGAGGWAAASSKLVSGDVNGDGKTDLIAMYDYGNSTSTVFTFLSSGSGFNSPQSQWNSGTGNWSTPSSDLVAGDYNGDGKADLGVFYTYPNAQTKIQVFTATSGGGLSSPSVWWDSGVNAWDGTRVLPFVGDYNGDGKSDLGALYNYNYDETGVFSFLSNGSSFAAPVRAWDSGAGEWDGYDVLVS